MRQRNKNFLLCILIYNNGTLYRIFYHTDIHLLPSKAQWLLYVPPGLTYTTSTLCPHYMFCVGVRKKNSDYFSVRSKRLVFTMQALI